MRQGSTTMARTLTMPAPYAAFPALPGLWPSMSAAEWLRGVGAVSGLLALLWAGQLAYQSTPADDIVPLAAASTVTLDPKPALVSSGVVHTIRELAAAAGSDARRFEMTIRMRDGSLRVSNETGDAGWRAGDRVSLIGGPAGR